MLIVAWLILHWAILPHIEQWRPQLERRASAALGVTVHIGGIEVRSSGWVPAFELQQVVLADAAGREALRLPRVAAAVSARSLLALEPRFEQLLIEGPELEVRRDAQGRLHVAGIALGGDRGSDDTGNADWLFAQHEFVIRGGKVRWIDERRDAPPLELADVMLVMRNGFRKHELRLQATPPPQWGERITLTGRFTQSLLARAGDWRRWSGTLHADLPRADVRELRRHVDLPFELTEGDGAVRAWLDIADGEPHAATVDVALAGVSMRLSPLVEPLAFARIEGRLSAQRRDDGLSLAAERFGFTTAEGLVWPAGHLALSLKQREGAAPTGGRFSADRIDLALAAGIAAKLPLGAALRMLLAELAPRGVVGGLAASWDGSLDAPQRYEAKARIAGLSIASRSSDQARGVGRPGIVNADLDLQASERGGEARLAIANGSLQLPGVFEQPELALQQFDAQLAWRIEARTDAPSRVELQVKNARFANSDAAGELDATWSTGAGRGLARGGRFPGQLDLSGKLDRGRAVASARYLPLGVPQPARRYVERAVKGGTLSSATFKVKGDLWDFPFYNARQGEFRIAARVHDVTFDYLPSVPPGADEPAWNSPWPGLTQVSGELLIDRGSMRIRDAQARLWGVELSKLNGRIDDLVNQPILNFEGSGRGPLADGLRYVNASPIGQRIGHALAQTTASGNADLKLTLRVPLHGGGDVTLDGSVVLADNDVRIRPDTPLLGRARGRVEFSQQGFAVIGATARVFGGDASFDGGSRPDGSLRFSGQGLASADGLRRAAELPLLARLAGSLSGQTPYRVALGIGRGGSEIAVTSQLVGVASSLPAPLGKSPEAPLAMRYQTTLAAEPGRDLLRFELGSLVQLQFSRDIAGAVPRVLRGGIGVGVGEAMPQPLSGVHANVNVATINVDAWQRAAGALFGGAGPGGATPTTSATADAGDGGGYAPTHVALRANEIVAEGRRLTRLIAGLTLVDGAWRANLDADQLHGYAEWRPARAAGAPGRVYARLTRLTMPQAEAQSFDALLDAEPTSVPALDIVVDDFELRGKKLGRVEIEAVNRGDAQQREWRLAKLALTMPEAQFSASGQWINTTAAKRRRSELAFKLDLADSGALLERLGFGKVIRGGKGRLQGQLGWDGSPLAFDAGSLAGDVNVAIDSGQFLKADPGVARLLGVLSLQSLPRRLALDFRDVFQQGFVFDNLTGDLHIAAGVANTNNLRMRGVQAAVLMEGSADLGRETQDLRVVVVPEINAATASLAYAVINPAIGLGTFLAQMFLRKPIAQATTREFHVSGPWAEPKVERVERKFNDPLPDDTPAAAAAPSPRNP